MNNRLPAQFRFSGPVDQVFTRAHQDSKLDRYTIANFKDFAALKSDKLKVAVDSLNEDLRTAGEVFVRRASRKNSQRVLQALGYARVEVLQPGDEYREAKLKVLVSDDYRVQDATKGLHRDAVTSFEFKTSDFDKVQIMNFADHKIRTTEIFYPQNDKYTPPDEPHPELIGSTGGGTNSLLAPEFPELYKGLPYFDKENN